MFDQEKHFYKKLKRCTVAIGIISGRGQLDHISHVFISSEGGYGGLYVVDRNCDCMNHVGKGQLDHDT